MYVAALQQLNIDNLQSVKRQHRCTSYQIKEKTHWEKYPLLLTSTITKVYIVDMNAIIKSPTLSQKQCK